MKLTVLDEDLFLQSIAFSSNADYLNNEYEVYAVCSLGSIKKNKHYLILLNDNCLRWCKDSNAVKIIGDMNGNWVFVSNLQVKGFDDFEPCKISFKDLYCYQWMLEDDKFLFESVYGNTYHSLSLLKEKMGLN